MLGPHSTAYAGNQKPNLVAVAGRYSVGRSLPGDHGTTDQVLDVLVEVGVLLEKHRTLHRVCRHSAQGQIENSIDSELNVLSSKLAAP